MEPVVELEPRGDRRVSGEILAARDELPCGEYAGDDDAHRGERAPAGDRGAQLAGALLRGRRRGARAVGGGACVARGGVALGAFLGRPQRTLGSLLFRGERLERALLGGGARTRIGRGGLGCLRRALRLDTLLLRGGRAGFG